MAKTVKEIGIKKEGEVIEYYGITLADDMVGQGLKKDENGAVTLQLGSADSASEVPLSMGAGGTLVFKCGDGLKQKNDALSLRYGTGLRISHGEIYVDYRDIGGDSGSSKLIIDDERALLLGSNTLMIVTTLNFASEGILKICWTEDMMSGIELRISSEDTGIYLGDGSLVLGGLTLSSQIRGLHVTHTINDAKDESGFLNIILREGSDIVFQIKDGSGNIHRGLVALNKYNP